VTTTAGLDGQVAIVTGAGRGVGEAIAKELARRGAAVAVAARTDREIDEVVRTIELDGGTAVAVPTDVTDDAAVAHLVEETYERLGPPSLLVNNAGTWQHVGPLEEADVSEWWRDIEVSLRGSFLCSRAVLPPMLERRAGRIVNVSSYAAIAPPPYTSAYVAAKAALLTLSESLALELRGRGVTVFAITPGFVRTAIVDRVARSPEGRKFRPDLVERSDDLPPEWAGRLVADIASGRLDALSGSFLHVRDDVDELLRRAEEIRDRGLYRLRLST
jgi:NAD(P)-dependent dehydrogenase (short-subunit alcohol dehydrogenase family)